MPQHRLRCRRPVAERAVGPDRVVLPAPAFEFGFYGPAQLFGEDWSVAGLRIAVFTARNQHVDGIDVSAFGQSDEYDVRGIQLGSLNFVAGDWRLEFAG